ncbi:hypothetical protein CEXT_100801 [Caerostris extrusa]|uniref:Uncharacterized protein n=1 Tax=Caerostris extrusa TaxID=172846 RepID=A0AAV4RFZ9_CAEEX|nr:hypothetical protein CEXT_100801 [Caerostris extrusa]
MASPFNEEAHVTLAMRPKRAFAKCSPSQSHGTLQPTTDPGVKIPRLLDHAIRQPSLNLRNSRVSLWNWRGSKNAALSSAVRGQPPLRGLQGWRVSSFNVSVLFTVSGF